MSEIKQGYKQTKVGIIPEDWEVVKLGKIAPLQRGYDLPTDSVQEGIYPVVYSNGILRFHNEYKAKAPGIVTGRSGTIGRVTYVEDNYWPHNTSLWVTNFYDNNPKFVYYMYINLDLTKFSAGSGVPTLNRNDVHIQDISLPPLKEQEKIAEILTTWDKSITKQTELLRAKELLKIALMQKLLSGEVRFDGFSDEWEEVRLGEIGQIVTGTTPPTDTKAYYENGQFPWITPTDINDKKDICKSERYLTSLGLEKGRFIPKGSLLVTCIASIGKNAILTVDGSCNQQINAILPSEKNNINYLYYFIEYKKDYLIKFAGQSATQILNKKSFSSLKIKLPSLSEQQKIAEVLSLADDEINLLKNELEELKLQKKALMQKLLTGQVRVKV